MAKTETLPIYIETYRLIREVFDCSLKFPKDYKYAFADRLNGDTLNLCCLISKANRETEKSTIISDFLLCLDKVRLQLRLCADYKLISYRRQAHLSQIMENITTQALAWQKHERRKENQQAGVGNN